MYGLPFNSTGLQKKKIGVWESFTEQFNISRIILIYNFKGLLINVSSFFALKGRDQCYALLRSKMQNTVKSQCRLCVTQGKLFYTNYQNITICACVLSPHYLPWTLYYTFFLRCKRSVLIAIHEAQHLSEQNDKSSALHQCLKRAKSSQFYHYALKSTT